MAAPVGFVEVDEVGVDLSYTPTAVAVSTAAPARHSCPAPSHQGLLEPSYPETGTAGSEGAAARQRAAATRQNSRPRSETKMAFSTNEGPRKCARSAGRWRTRLAPDLR